MPIRCSPRSVFLPSAKPELKLRQSWQIVEASKAWRDAWRDILGTQQRLLSNFDGIYAPIIGASEEYQGHVPVVTPQAISERTSNLNGTYDELRNDLLEELNNVEARIIRPATEAKEYIHPLKKVIKKRGDKKVRTGKCHVTISPSHSCAVRL